LEQSRATLERNGLWIAAVSYDSQETLQAFAKENGIEFPLVSDCASNVIRRFGIFNSNIAPGLQTPGVPHP
jgi:peroxiredoxin